MSLEATLLSDLPFFPSLYKFSSRLEHLRGSIACDLLWLETFIAFGKAYWKRNGDLEYTFAYALTIAALRMAFCF